MSQNKERSGTLFGRNEEWGKINYGSSKLGHTQTPKQQQRQNNQKSFLIKESDKIGKEYMIVKSEKLILIHKLYILKLFKALNVNRHVYINIYISL